MRRNFSEAWKFQRFFSPKTGGLQKKKKRSSPKFRLVFRPKSEILTFFRPKQVVSKKKKKVFTEIQTDFPAKIGNSNVFSAQKQVVSKKKRSSPKFRLIFRPKSEILTFFPPKTGGLQKKKVFTEIQTDFPAKIGNSNAFSGRITTCTSQLRHPISFKGGLFSIFHQKSASKAPKTCDFAYFTSQWGKGSSPPPPPPLATLLNPMFRS